MAIGTYTASSQAATPRAVHVGVNAAMATWTRNAVASSTLSDVILLVRIPDKAWITGGFFLGTHGAIGTGYKIGTAADDDAVHLIATLSATAVRTIFSANTLPFKVSLSDDVEPKWTWLRAERITEGSSTLTESVKVYVEYVMHLF